MEPLFKSLGQELYSHGHHKGYFIKWNLLSPLCKKWSRNRDPDMQRVSEMVEFYKGGGYIPKMIHLAEVTGEGLICYDGNHRRETFDRLASGDNELECIIDVIFNASQRQVYEAYENINKAVQLPAIYLEETDDSHKVQSQIVTLVKEYEVKYKPFVSTSPRYHAPNFNRDTFVDNIYQIYKSLNGTVSISDLSTMLERLNAEYAKANLCRPHSAYKANVIEKCAKYGLWLFLERIIPCEHVERLVRDICINK